MKLWPAALAIGVWTLAFSPGRQSPGVLVIIGGDVNGYLAPCGCTKPMSGGIQKRAGLIRSLAKGRQSVILENGGLISGQGRQDVLKAETLAEALKSVGTAAITLGYSEARVGQGMAISLNQLTGRRLVNSALNPSSTNEIQRWVEKGPFLIGALDSRTTLVAGALSEEPLSAEAAVKGLAREAKSRGKRPLLLLQGARDEAARLAEAEPSLALIVYRSSGTPPDQPGQVGNTWLATPGDRGLFVVCAKFAGGAFSEYRVLKVEAALKDDPSVLRLYRGYLDRLTGENLVAKIPRSAGPVFVGSAKCAKCHPSAAKAWKASKHAVALRSLDSSGHAKDPECLPCHVVGLRSRAGFRSRTQTPHLASVGCESCHGPAAAHAANPSKARLSKAGPKSCAPCHNLDHSPGFVFPSFWKTIAHK